MPTPPRCLKCQDTLICPACGGMGETYRPDGDMDVAVKCRACQGDGECRACQKPLEKFNLPATAKPPERK